MSDLIYNRNGTDKTNTISENPTKNEVSLDFYRSLTSHIGNKGALVHVYFRNDLGVRLLDHVR